MKRRGGDGESGWDEEAGQIVQALGSARGPQDGREGARTRQGKQPGGQAGGAAKSGSGRMAQDDGKGGDIEFVPGKRVTRHEATLDYDTVLGRLTLVKHWEQPERQTDPSSRGSTVPMEELLELCVR